MPSHWIHVVIGSRICGFFSKEIDRLIDFSEKASKEIENDNSVIIIPLPQLPGMVTIYSNMDIKNHDGSRFSCKILLSQARDVLSKFSDKGLCYYILHHYLDKFMNILTGQLLNIYSRVKEHDNAFNIAINELISNFKENVKQGLETEVSVFKALELIVDKGFTDPFRDYFELIRYEMKLFEEYKSKTRRNKMIDLEILLYKCIEVLRNSENRELAKHIVEIARNVREKIIENAERVFCMLVKYMYQDNRGRERLIKLFGDNKRIWLLMKSLKCI